METPIQNASVMILKFQVCVKNKQFESQSEVNREQLTVNCGQPVATESEKQSSVGCGRTL